MEKNQQNESDILLELLSLAEKKGDLPIFNASLNNVRRISSDPESDAMELAQTVMRDANLCAKLLRVANSPYYSRGLAKISSISRVVVLLGFDVIKSLCLTLKLIENFQDEHPAIGMHKMVARSYLSAGFVRDIAIMSNIKNAEETYVSGLCHNIGEIALGYFMPDKIQKMTQLCDEEGISWEKAQKEVLGVSLAHIGQAIGKEWNFSDKVISSMSTHVPKNEDGPARTPHQLNHAIVALSSQIVDTIYLKDGRSNKNLRELFHQLEESTGIKANRLEKSLASSFTRSCELINSYGLNPAVLCPDVSDSEDTLRDKFSRDFSFLASSQAEDIDDKSHGIVETALNNASTKKEPHTPETTKNKSVKTTSSPEISEPTATPKGDAMAQLAYIQEITALVTERASLSTVFTKILQGLKEGVGFDRVALSLVSPDRRSYATRITLGDDSSFLSQNLRGTTDPAHDIFARIIDEGGDLLIDDLHDGTWNSLISQEILNGVTSDNIIIAGLKHGSKPIGLFYADNEFSHARISPLMRRGFLQFIAQSRLAVQIVN